MKHLFYALIFLCILSCGSDKIVQLPEIEKATITEIHDVSPIYIFYDKETDSVEFNRKNMIGTTNWLVNIDKRLTLKQILPHLQYLQEKRHGDGMHKNKNAKNYFTCHDTSTNNLGFLEFTDVYYNMGVSEKPNEEIEINVNSLEKISLKKTSDAIVSIESSLDNLINDLNALSSKRPIETTLFMKGELTFQDYITLKDYIMGIKQEQISINSHEFIY